MRIIIIFLCLVFAEEVVEEPKIKELNKKNFGVATRTGITIIEFWAEWNKVNRMAFLDSVEIKDAKVYRVNIDMNPEVTAKEKIVVVPTLVIYDDGFEYKRLQADLTFILKTSTKDLQAIVDEILMSKF